MPSAAIAGAVFALTLAAVITRPRGIPEAWWAAGGAALMLVLRIVPPQSALFALAGQWNLFLFFLGLMMIAGLADASGFFDAAAALAAGAAQGSGRRLLLAIFAVGALIAAFLSNDATALILTPVVYAVVTRLHLPPMPYLFATTFIADTASILLPVSNPINVLVGSRLALPLPSYVDHLLPAGGIVVALNAAVFLLVFRRQVAHRFQIDWREALAQASLDRRHLRLTTIGLAVIGIAYLVASATGIPLGPVAVGGAILLTSIALGSHGADPKRVREHVSLSLLIYVAGLLVLVQGLQDTGMTAAVVGQLLRLVHGPFAAVAVGVLGAGIAANLVNNLPATLFLLSGAHGAALSAALRAPFLVGVLAGADLGPNLTPVGSLSTMLWLVIIRRKGIQVSALDYLKLGALVTPLLLLSAWLVIGATFR